MTEPLYSLDVLRLAAASADTGRLPRPDASVEQRSPLCGSRIIVDVVLDAQKRIDLYGHEIHACALGQAAATLVARNAIGKTASEIADAALLTAEFLAGITSALPDWPGIEILERARDYPARHPSVRLAFECAAQAIKKAGQ